MWIFYTAVGFAGLLISFLISKNKLSKKHEAAQTGLAGMEEERKAREDIKRLRGSSREGVAEKGAGVDVVPPPPEDVAGTGTETDCASRNEHV